MLSDAINWHIDEAQLKEEREQRAYLGASLIGYPCERQIQYRATATPVDEGKGFPPRILRCFQRGHWAEEYAVKLLRQAGFMLLDVDPDTGKQFEFKLFNGRVAGHCDGIIPLWRGQGSTPFQVPALWECKCLNNKSTNKAKKDKLYVSHNHYYNQIQLYMGELSLPRCLFTIINADSMEIYHQMIDYDQATHKAMVDRAWRILQAIDAREWLPRGFGSSANFECKYCDHSLRCWNEKG